MNEYEYLMSLDDLGDDVRDVVLSFLQGIFQNILSLRDNT